MKTLGEVKLSSIKNAIFCPSEVALDLKTTNIEFNFKKMNFLKQQASSVFFLNITQT